MRQVPFYSIIGGGRLASHLVNYFTLKKISFSRWARNQGTALSDHISLLPEGAVVLLAVSDDAIEKLIEEHPPLRNFSPIHFSGCASIPGVCGAHPLTSFARDTSAWDFKDYEAIPFVLENGGAKFEDIFPGFKNPSYYIDASQKPLYHALCVAAGNFTTMLWNESARQFSNKLALPPGILHPYLDRISANIKNEGENALTGPLARRDAGTICRNLAALKGTALEQIYLSFLSLAGISVSKGGDVL